ncbi:MAG: hypothetical protein FIB07_01445 [Candidatus Methanoperedens sp.]|nr:hypothetical protein [Candidatus Methanoperedens sp.]
MTYQKKRLGLLVGFSGATFSLFILTLFVPATTIFFALVIGFLFVLPIAALVSLFLGAYTVPKKPKKPSKKEVIISTIS